MTFLISSLSKKRRRLSGDMAESETAEQKGRMALTVNGALIGLATLLGLVFIALPASGLPVFSIGLIPFMIIAAGMIAICLVTVIARVPLDVVGEIAVAVGTIGLIVLCVLLFISHVCLRIQPVEHFVSETRSQTENPTSFLDALAKTEADVCKLVDDTNNYIQSDVGAPGISTPELVTVAQEKAVAAVPGPIVTCPPSSSSNKESLTPVQRLERLEMTLNQFVEPEFKSACLKAGVCSAGEGFEDGSDDSDGSPTDPVVLQRRLAAVNAKVRTLTVTYLDPMNKKKEDLQKGQASDSDKQKGAASAVVPVTPSSPSD
jgi:hypothetical protein